MRSVLVANRGEIARRVFHTCRRAGISTVAVFSDADAGSPYVAEADVAVRLTGNSPAETYLRGDLVVDAALRAGADAVHPGYGFLSENADFAHAVIDAGLTWIGPPPDAIAMMGSKVEAKRIMAAAGVPTLDVLDPEAITAEDLPVLVKASAGGGGRGMRVVRDLAALPGEIAAARDEAASAFGDPTVFCEPYIATGHHIEVQVLADRQGGVWAVAERECSIQRRHQKVVEEAPSPLVGRIEGMRERLYDAAVAATSAIDYEGAGTVEFLADDEGRFFFLEMNTRLQVEHPVTELTTGFDLVRLQLDIARGLPLPPERPAASGAAVEVRLYAEDPAEGWQPQSGVLRTFDVPDVATGFGLLDAPGIRVDSGVVSGSQISVFYDPMLAKVIAYADRRDDAARALADVLRRSRLHGLRTNRDLLVRVLEHPSFLAGETDTAFLDTHGLDALSAPLADAEAERLSALAAALAEAERRRAGQPGVHARLPLGWRNLPSQPHTQVFEGRAGEHPVRYRLDRGRLRVEGREDVVLVTAEPGLVVLEVAGLQRRFHVVAHPDAEGATEIEVDSSLGSVSLRARPRFQDPSAAVAPGSLLAPLPGVVMKVMAEVGDEVGRGEPLLVLEAMKMQHTIAAPVTGVVRELPVAAGQHVEVGATLAVVAEKDAGDGDEAKEQA